MFDVAVWKKEITASKGLQHYGSLKPKTFFRATFGALDVQATTVSSVAKQKNEALVQLHS